MRIGVPSAFQDSPLPVPIRGYLFQFRSDSVPTDGSPRSPTDEAANVESASGSGRGISFIAGVGEGQADDGPDTALPRLSGVSLQALH